MGLAVALTQDMYLQDSISQLQYNLQFIVNTLTRLSMNSSDVVAKQNAAVQAYLQQHKDEEGEVAFEYVNSSAFTARFDAELRQIQAKETILEQEKASLELEINEKVTAEEGQGKLAEKGAKDCKYFD